MGNILRKSFFLIATQPFVGLNFLFAMCKKIALPLYFITGFLSSVKQKMESKRK